MATPKIKIVCYGDKRGYRGLDEDEKKTASPNVVNADGFVIVELTNTVKYGVGEWVPKAEIEHLCLRPNYTVVVKAKPKA
jgi:hypothetical protein